LLTAALAILPSGSFAHAPKVGENGGAQTDAGSFHVELVAKETNIDVYLRDHSNKAVATVDFKGAAIFVIDGKPLRIELAPAGDNRLTGTAAVALPQPLKGAVLITTPSGSTARGKFQ
jgi:hypothetical protein